MALSYMWNKLTMLGPSCAFQECEPSKHVTYDSQLEEQEKNISFCFYLCFISSFQTF